MSKARRNVRRFTGSVFISLTACLVASCGRQDAQNTASSVTSPAESQAGAVATAKPEFLRLVGKWERSDGGYMLEIKGVDGEGRLEATYLNPNPIHVSRAIAFQ